MIKTHNRLPSRVVIVDFMPSEPYVRTKETIQLERKRSNQHQGGPCPLPFDFYVVLTLAKMAPVVIVKPFLLMLDLRCYDQYLYFAAFSLALGYLIDK